jgi:hypothetical protein
MTTTLAVPATLEGIVQRYDAKEESFTEFDISGELNAARNALIDPSEHENLGAWAEVLAFGLQLAHTRTPGTVTSARWARVPTVRARQSIFPTSQEHLQSPSTIGLPGRDH